VPANFAVTDANGNTAFVSGVALNAAKTEATLTFFNKFTDGGVYTVTTSNVVDANSNTIATSANPFIYAKADVATVAFTGTTILPGGNVNTLVKVTDTLGRDVTTETNVVFESSNVDVVNATGVAANPSITNADSAIVVAKVLVGTTYVRSAITTITVSASTAASYTGSYVYGVTPAAATTADFAKLTAAQKVDFVNMGDDSKKLAVYYTDQFGKDTLSDVVAFNGASQPTLTNLNPNVVVVENDGIINPISVGSGYVKIVNGTVTTTVKITVKAAPAIDSMTADKTTISIGSVAPLNAQTVNVTYKDQFGTAIDPTTTLKATPADPTIATAVVGPSNKSLVITGLKEGTTTVALSYKVDANTTLTQNIAVTVTKAGTLAGYAVENAAATLDLNIDNIAVPSTPKTSVVKVFSVDANGNKIAELTPGTGAGHFSLTTVDATGTPAADIVTAATDTVTAQAVGTGYVQVTVGSLVFGTLQFNVSNTGTVATTASFNSLAIVLGNPTLPATLTTALTTELQKIVSVQDQNGVALAGFDNTNLHFVYVITNVTGMTITGTGDAQSLGAFTAKNGLADIVVTKVTDGTDNTTNLIATPVVVKLSVTAPTLTPTLSKATATGAFANKDNVNEMMTALFASAPSTVQGIDINPVLSVNAGAIAVNGGNVTPGLLQWIKTQWGGTSVPVAISFSSGTPVGMTTDANWSNGYTVWVDLGSIAVGTTPVSVLMTNGTTYSYDVTVK